MFRSIFKIITFMLLCLSTTIHANTGLPNPSARPQKTFCNFDLFASALYWLASQTADWTAILTISPQVENVTYKPISFDFSPGFRIGAGYNLRKDSWDTQASYTHFSTCARDEATGQLHTAFFGQTISGVGFFQTGLVDWTIDYNMFDIDLGRSFCISKCLSIRPSIGLKGGWIDQKIKTKWTRPELLFTLQAKENLKNDFSGLGPKICIESKWRFACLGIYSFSLLSEASSAFLWGHFDISDFYQDNFFVSVDTKVKDRNFGCILLKAFLGLGWEFNFNANRSHFALKAGYEIEDWLNQFQVFDDASGANSNDLVLQGLTVNLRFDF